MTEITQDMIDAAGNYYIDSPSDGLNPGFHGRVSELASWQYHDFRVLVSNLLKKSIATAEKEAAYQQEREAIKRAELADRLKVIPDLYLKQTNKDYAKEARALIRRWSTLQRAPKPQGTPLRSLYVYGQSGRGKSHYAGKLAEQLVEIGRVEWCNAEELDSIIQRASGGHAGFNDMLNDIVAQIKRARFVVVDDLGKPDTKCDGVTVPKRVALLHQIIEDARINCNRQFIFTSEHAPDEQIMRMKLSEGLVNRIIEMCDVVKIDESEKYIDWIKTHGAIQ